MGIFCILAGVVLGFIALLIFFGASAITGQLFAGEVAICGAALFGAGAVINAIEKLQTALTTSKVRQIQDDAVTFPG